MADILAQIVAAKRADLAGRMAKTPLPAMREQASAAPPPRPFAAALQDNSRLPVIAEIKRRSPSKGVLCDPFDPPAIAAAYAAGGAACLSVLTDAPFFGGADDDLRAARAACDLPALRKDFMLCEWQIYESRALGADVILLIAAVLDLQTMQELAQTALALGMAVLAEVHDEKELQMALTLPPSVLIGINNRNLKTFVTDLQTTLDLLPLVRAAGDGSGMQRCVVSESGIHSAADTRRLLAAGANAFLVGEALVNAPKEGLARLF